MDSAEPILTYIVPITLGGQITLLPREDGTYGGIATTNVSKTLESYGSPDGTFQVLGGLIGGHQCEIAYGVAILDQVRRYDGATHVQDLDPSTIDEPTRLALEDICMRSENELMPTGFNMWPLHEQISPEHVFRHAKETPLQMAAGK